MIEILDEHLAEMVTTIILWELSKSFQDRKKAGSTMENIFDTALVRLIEIRHIDDLIGERLTTFVNTEGTIHMMTDSIMVDRTFIAPLAIFVQRNTQKVPGELKALCYDEQFQGNR